MSGVSIELSKPIKVGEDEIRVLYLREPTVKDVGDIGYPFLLLQTDGGAAIQLQPKAVLKYVSRLAAVPPSSLDGLALSDLSELQTVVMGFFGQEAATPQA